jgi:hypothetical protein
MDIIRNADWVVDLGPDGGDKGGTLVYQGKIEDFDKARVEVNAIRKEMADARQEITREVVGLKREISKEVEVLKRETSKEVEVLKREVDNKIQKAIDNPLANK